MSLPGDQCSSFQNISTQAPATMAGEDQWHPSVYVGMVQGRENPTVKVVPSFVQLEDLEAPNKAFVVVRVLLGSPKKKIRGSAWRHLLSCFTILASGALVGADAAAAGLRTGAGHVLGPDRRCLLGS